LAKEKLKIRSYAKFAHEYLIADVHFILHTSCTAMNLYGRSALWPLPVFIIPTAFGDAVENYYTDGVANADKGD
jgi:hypothetical protein